MSVFDQELILPGVITDIMSDYSSGYDTSLFGTTDSVAIIGTAFNGPVGRPVKIYSPEHARYVFGAAYDSATRREATLVAEIQDAWDRGCRTIYAVRVSGKEMFKDFQLAADTDCKLRVSGIFPNNGNKDVFFEYDPVDTLSEVANGEETCIRIFKPATRATIEEKMLGKVISENSILVNEIKLSTSWNITKTTRLVDFINAFNNYAYNNVIKLSIVDKDGNEVTNTSEAQGLVFADLFPGVYFIGRDKNADKVEAKTEVEKVFVPEEDRDTIYENFVDNFWKTLKCNTDVTADLPIYCADATGLNKLIGAVEGITMIKLFDFLNVPGKVDLIWMKDKEDYEQVNVGDFDMYKLLGSGFANTAKIVETKEGSGVFKVVEVTSETDPNRVVGINDGIYSMLENLRCDYRVLTGKYADVAIKGRLPKKADFLVSCPQSSDVLDEKVKAFPVIAKEDLGAVKNYKFELNALAEDAEILDKDAVIEKLYNKEFVYGIAQYAFEGTVSDLDVNEFKEGDLVIEAGTMVYKVINGEFVDLTDKSEIYGSEFENKLIVTNAGIYEKDGAQTDMLMLAAADLGEAVYINVEVDGKIVLFEGTKPVALFNEVLEEASDMFAVVVPVIENNVVVNKVSISAINLDSTTLGELIIAMNQNAVLKEKFEFDLGAGLTEATKYELIADIFGDINVADTDAVVDRAEPVYDQSKYIPFKTNDNFARQLAQHCTYTGLKTAPTHGVIGCSKIVTTNLKAIANKVDELTTLDLNLYAKKPNGNDMLDKNNLPYPIGRCVSVTFFQTNVETGDNYTYVSPGASAYAGMVSTLPIDQSSTAQPINLSNITFELTNYQLGRLTQAGFVTVKNSFNQGFVITDGITMAPVNSPFRRLSVTRIINGVGEAIQAAAEPFIGKQNHLANRNSLQTAIKSVLDKMLNNLIEKYDFKVINDKAAERMGIIEIEYTIVPIYEIREVRNRITVKDNL